MRHFVGALGLAGSVVALAYWIAVVPGHEASTVVLMLVLIGLGLVGSRLAAVGSIWVASLIALGAVRALLRISFPG